MSTVQSAQTSHLLSVLRRIPASNVRFLPGASALAEARPAPGSFTAKGRFPKFTSIVHKLRNLPVW